MPYLTAHPSDINEAKILAAANQIVSLGLKDLGYTYVNIDVSDTHEDFIPIEIVTRYP